MPAGASPTPPRAGRLVLALLLFALAPSLGTLDAPWIAEDAAILGEVHASGPWVDWTRSQGGLRLLSFWRPLVSTSWALQEAASGIDVLPLRLFNLALHALVALGVVALARRLGAGTGALLAGLWVAAFPEQGGTVTWLAGRTDLLCALFLVASAWVALGRRAWFAAPLAFLACAAKEFGFLAPAWVFLLAWGRGDGARPSLRRAGPAALGVALALLWRRAALGDVSGGYPVVLPGLVEASVGVLRALSTSAWPSLLLLALVLAAGILRSGLAPRALLAALACVLLALVPLVPLLADGLLEPQNRRLFFVADCAVALGVAAAWGRAGTAPRRGLVALLLALAALLARLELAAADTHEWAAAARHGEAQVAAARAALQGAEAGVHPVLSPAFDASHGGAYCLGFGLAARFRAPFPATPRPVWPWRLVFTAQAARVRAPLCAPRADGTLWPLDDPRPGVAELLVRDEGGARARHARVDERALLGVEDRSPRLFLEGGPSGAGYEAVLYSELGYEPVPLGLFDAQGAGTFTLQQLLAATNGAAAGAQVLAQAADLGATRAYLELRAVAPSGEVLAASPWIELDWPPTLIEAAVSAR